MDKKDKTDTPTTQKSRRKFRYSNLVTALNLIISLVSLTISILALYEVRHQWQATNLGKVVVVSKGWIYRKSYSQDEVAKIDFGYKPDFVSSINEDRVAKAELLIPSKLIAVDNKTKELIPDLSAITLEDIKSKLISKGITLENVTIKKEYTIQFACQKTGNTIAKNLEVKIDTKKWEEDGWLEGNWSKPEDLLPETSLVITQYFDTKLDTPLPKFVQFRAFVKYIDAENKPVEYEINFNETRY